MFRGLCVEAESGYLMISRSAKIQNKQHIMERLGRTLHELKADGVFQEIYSKYLN